MNLDEVTIHFNESQVFILNFCLAFIMFGVALDINPKDFYYVFKNKKSTLVGLFSQLLVLPALTLCLIWLMRPAPSISLGMLLISVCPGGNVSNYAVYLGRGNTALSVVLTATSTLTSSLLTPLGFSFLFYLLPPSLQKNYVLFSLPLPEMVITVCTLLIIPLLLGLGINVRYPKLQKAILPWIKKGSFFLFTGIIVSGLISNLDNIRHYLDEVFLIVLLHNSLALIAGFFIGRFFNLPDRDNFTISVETGIQNSGLALVLIFSFFNGLGGMALVAAWWSIWHLISSLGMAYYWRRRLLSENNGL